MGARAILAERGTLRLEGVVTGDDLRHAMDAIASRITERDEQFIEFVAGTTDAAGALTFTLFTVPAAFEANIVAVMVEAAGYTVASPYSAAGAYVSLHRGPPALGNMVDFTPSSTGVLPCLFTYGSDARLLRSSAQFVARIVAGPASTPVVAWLQGVMRPTLTP